MNLYKHLTEEEYIKIQESRSGYGGNLEIANWGKYFLKHYSEYVESPILDIGCGAGSLLNYWKKRNKFAMGLDISRESSRGAIENGFSVINQDVQKRLALPDKSFKTVTMFHTLEHTLHPKKVLKNIHRIIAEGGNLCTITPLVPKNEQYGHFTNLPTIEHLENLFKDYNIIISKELDQGHLIIASPK